MDIELVHAKLARGEDMAGNAVYNAVYVFGSPFTDAKGKHIGKSKQINMGFANGMPPEDFVIGLRALADHIEEVIINSDDFKETPTLTVVDNSG